VGVTDVPDVAPGDGVRVVMVVRLFHPWIGGMERQAHKLSRALRATGAEVEILTGRWFRGTPHREVVDDIVVTRHQTLWEFGGIRGLRRFGGYLYLVTLFAALWRRRRDTDVIHVHGCNYHTAAAVAVGRLTRTPVVVKLANSGHGSDLAKMRRGDQLPLSGLLVPLALRADRFVALNPEVRAELLAAGVAADRIVDIPNGVEPGPARDGYALHDPARVVFVGRLHEQKGVDVLLGALARLRADRPDLPVQLDLLGEGPEEAALRALASRHGRDREVRFVGRCDDVAGRVAAADVFVLPSRAEGLSNALLEAAALGTPCIVTDLPGNRRVVTDGHDGAVVPVGDDRRLATTLARLLDDEPTRERLGRAARATVEDRFTVASVAASYLALYRQLTGEDGVRSIGSATAPVVVAAGGEEG
jgi:L-malate glycosyltransferase